MESQERRKEHATQKQHDTTRFQEGRPVATVCHERSLTAARHKANLIRFLSTESFLL